MRKPYGWLPVLALVVFVFLLGHDALMAADPHRQDAIHHMHGADVVVETTCPMPERVHPTTPDLPAPDVMNVAFVMDTLPLPFLDFSSVGWDLSPDHPPDVRRAFLQVFLN